MGRNSGKFYDAEQTKNYCGALEQAKDDYLAKAGEVHTANANFAANELFKGLTAINMKDFIKSGTGTLLKDVTDMHQQMVEAQNKLINDFEQMVDSSSKAHIEFDTLEEIDGDFKKFYNTFVPITEKVEKIVNDLNNEFSDYGPFPQPDSKSAISEFEFICGGESVDGGYFKSCQKKLVNYDSAMVSYLKSRPTMDLKTNIDQRISRTTYTLGGYNPFQVKKENHSVYKLPNLTELSGDNEKKNKDLKLPSFNELSGNNTKE